MYRRENGEQFPQAGLLDAKGASPRAGLAIKVAGLTRRSGSPLPVVVALQPDLGAEPVA